jgi:hypothetical protein
MYIIHVITTCIMTPRKNTPSVREPVQVYLAGPDRILLDQVASKTGLSRAEVLRRGVRRMAAEALGENSPMRAFIREQAESEWPAEIPRDAAERHDEYLVGATPRNAKVAKRRRR